MTTHATHISVAHGDGAVVTVRPTDDGRWFRVLNWLVDAGHWSNLTDAQRNVFVVILRHRRAEDGLASVSIAAICGSTRLRESAVYEAVKGLLAHKPPLLRKHSPQLWEPFPNRPFRQRPPDSATAESSPPRRTRVQHGGISPSHSPSAQKDQTERQQQQQPQELRAQERLDPDAAAAAAAAVEAAGRAGIKQAEAADLIVVYGGVRVFNAITESKARKGAPIRDPARWVRGALVQGWDLPDHWADHVGRLERAARLRGEAAGRLRAMVADWHADDRAVILAAFGTADRLAAWLDTEPFGMAWRSYGADRLGRKVADAVRGGLVGQELRA